MMAAPVEAPAPEAPAEAPMEVPMEAAVEAPVEAVEEASAARRRRCSLPMAWWLTPTRLRRRGDGGGGHDQAEFGFAGEVVGVAAEVVSEPAAGGEGEDGRRSGGASRVPGGGSRGRGEHPRDGR